MPDYLITPYDVLFFRGNKSFDFGQWHTEGVFPPYPSTFQGFVRNKMLVDAGLIDYSGKIQDKAQALALIGDDASLKVSITGPFLMDCSNNEIYFPTPADLYRKKEDESPCRSAGPADNRWLESDLDYSLACGMLPEKKPEKVMPPQYISLSTLSEYRKRIDNITVAPADLTTEENRVGIMLNRDYVSKGQKSVQSERFYVTPYQRMKHHAGLFCHTDKPLKNGPLKLGSESHLVGVAALTTENKLEDKLAETRENLVAGIIASKTLRIVLLHPGIFPGGWLPFPERVEKGILLMETDDLLLQLICAYTGAPLRISGYSFEKNRNGGAVTLKPLINAVPAGAVYMLRIINGTDEQIKAFIHKYDNRKIPVQTYSAMGFNHVILAVGPNMDGMATS